MFRGQKSAGTTDDLPSVLCWFGHMSITNNLATVYRLPIGISITIYMAGLDCHLVQMASSFNSRFGNSFTKVQNFCIRCDEALMRASGDKQKSTHFRQPSNNATGNLTDNTSGHSTQLSMNVNPKTVNRRTKGFCQIAAHILC